MQLRDYILEQIHHRETSPVPYGFRCMKANRSSDVQAR